MKNYIKYSILALAVFGCQISYCTNYNVDEVNAELKKCYVQQTSACFFKLSRKYDIPLLRYYYGAALINEKQITKAKHVLEELVETQSKSSKVYKLADLKLKELEKLQKDMQNARAHDNGDYYNELKDKMVWQNPASIKVFVKGKTGKEYILRNAFIVWDRCQSSINFETTYDEKEADIICYYVERLEGTKAGTTKLSYLKAANSGKKYINKAIILISMNKPKQGGKYTNSELLSITLHEVGHSIGIVSHSDNINDIMYYSTGTYRNATLSKRDINTVRKLYRQGS